MPLNVISIICDYSSYSQTSWNSPLHHHGGHFVCVVLSLPSPSCHSTPTLCQNNGSDWVSFCQLFGSAVPALAIMSPTSPDSSFSWEKMVLGEKEIIWLFWRNCILRRGRKLIYCDTMNLFFLQRLYLLQCEILSCFNVRSEESVLSTLHLLQK